VVGRFGWHSGRVGGSRMYIDKEVVVGRLKCLMREKIGRIPIQVTSLSREQTRCRPHSEGYDFLDCQIQAKPPVSWFF
jgi:hypothetical protein